MAQIILFGNKKGGSGKTTTSMHLIVWLLQQQNKVASIDLDEDQQSLSRYIENRKNTAAIDRIPLLLPEHFKLDTKCQLMNNGEIFNESTNQTESELFVSLLISLKKDYDFIVIDTPGNHTNISKLAHSYANKVVTPINDSFLDLDLIGKVKQDDFDMIAPGVYSAMLFEQKLNKAARDKDGIDWILVRNRLSMLDANNKKNIDLAVYKLSKKLGFRIAPGFGDRVIFKELFLSGLTLYDAGVSPKVKINTSVLAARQELREFIKALRIKNIIDKINPKIQDTNAN